MSTNDATGETVLPQTFGVAFILECDGCGTHEFAAHEEDRFKRMQDLHQNFCQGGVSTHQPSSRGPTA